MVKGPIVARGGIEPLSAAADMNPTLTFPSIAVAISKSNLFPHPF